MRRATFAILLALCASAMAQSGDEVRARTRVPGKGAVSEQFDYDDWKDLLVDLELNADKMAAVKAKIDELNEQRKGLFAALKAAQDELADADKKVSAAADALVMQEKELHKLIRTSAPLERQETYDLFAEILPLIKWLELSDAQVTRLLGGLQQLSLTDPHKELKKIMVAAQDGPLTKDDRDARIELLKKCQTFDEDWLKAIRGVLEDEQKTKWDIRYRRTHSSE